MSEQYVTLQGNSLEVLKDLPDNSVDSVVTDPPYGLSFMGKKWDYDVPSTDIWREVLRVLKPGGYLLSFGGTRTYHRMVVNIEDAGFEIRDQIQWLYGSGFPKSHDVSKAIDKAAGAEREVVGQYKSPEANTRKDTTSADSNYRPDQPEIRLADALITAPATPEAKQWEGWGTALKPANEPIVLARKPLSEKTVAENVLKWGTGGLNIDATRIGTEKVEKGRTGRSEAVSESYGKKLMGTEVQEFATGRFPANLILDECAAEMLDAQSGALGSGGSKRNSKKSELHGWTGTDNDRIKDSGGASRFFYVAKASKRERGEGNVHPTVKPIKLMEYLIKLITPPNGVILDPFMGSGSTGVAAIGLGYTFLGIELSQEYVDIAEKRLKSAS